MHGGECLHSGEADWQLSAASGSCPLMDLKLGPGGRAASIASRRHSGIRAIGRASHGPGAVGEIQESPQPCPRADLLEVAGHARLAAVKRCITRRLGGPAAGSGTCLGPWAASAEAGSGGRAPGFRSATGRRDKSASSDWRCDQTFVSPRIEPVKGRLKPLKQLVKRHKFCAAPFF
jgi:hypothetical protein